MTPYDLERDAAKEAARLAGKLCMAVRGEAGSGVARSGIARSGIARMEKSGREPVTVADYGAQAVILRHISQRLPADGSLAEERAAEFGRLASESARDGVLRHVGAALGLSVTADDMVSWLDYGRDRQTSRVWVVDPIDGTKGFLRGDQFAVAVALLVDGQPVVGALACPVMPFGAEEPSEARGVVAVAVRGQGVTVEPLDGGLPRPVRVSGLAEPASARIVESVEVDHTDHGFSAVVLKQAGVHGLPVRIDSQAKYFAVADGRAEIYIRNSRSPEYRENVWDHAAGVLIVQEAGGRVTDLDGRPIDFTHGSKLERNRGILATNGPVHDALLSAIAGERG